MFKYYWGLLKALPETFRTEWKKWEFYVLVPLIFSPALASRVTALALPWWVSPLSMVLLFAFLFLRANYNRFLEVEARMVQLGEHSLKQDETIAGFNRAWSQMNTRLAGANHTNANFLSYMNVKGIDLRKEVMQKETDNRWKYAVGQWEEQIFQYLRRHSPLHAQMFKMPVPGPKADYKTFSPEQTHWILYITDRLTQMEKIAADLRSKG